jgi:hypothetical protein
MKKFKIVHVVLSVLVVLSVITGCGLEPPLQITRRDSITTAILLQPSSVLIFTNLSDKHLSVNLRVISKDGRNEHSLNFNLLPYERDKEIGIFESGGWAFESGETIKISVPGYLTKTLIVP